MTSDAATVEEYLAGLPEERREAIQRVREVIFKNLPEGFEERMQYGMINYVVPHSLYPPGYHTNPKIALPFAALASQKHYMALYVLGPDGDPETVRWFKEAYAASGKKLDMGKSCVRFKKLEDLPLDVVGELMGKISVEQYVASYERNLATSRLARK